MKPICIRCERFYRPKRNGFKFIEGMPNRQHACAGTGDPAAWSPYKLWTGDLWECPDCGAQIIVGVGIAPISEHYMDDFDHKVQAHGAELLVKDC